MLNMLNAYFILLSKFIIIQKNKCEDAHAYVQTSNWSNYYVCIQMIYLELFIYFQMRKSDELNQH